MAGATDTTQKVAQYFSYAPVKGIVSYVDLVDDVVGLWGWAKGGTLGSANSNGCSTRDKTV